VLQNGIPGIVRQIVGIPTSTELDAHPTEVENNVSQDLRESESIKGKVENCGEGKHASPLHQKLKQKEEVT